MKINEFPSTIRSYLLPKSRGKVAYECLGCQKQYGIEKLHYTCPDCGSVLLLNDLEFDWLKEISPEIWQMTFNYRQMLTGYPELQGIGLFYELIMLGIPMSSVVYLGEGHTPLVYPNKRFRDKIGHPFAFKQDGLNPSLSFKDRGMASAYSHLNALLDSNVLESVLAICASTGDTSASSALYAASLGNPKIKSVVLLPQGKVTPEQLSQPLGAGAKVIQMPGVFDDCMKVVEYLSEHFDVALLNSKNAWRILGQESYSYEIAQTLNWNMDGIVIFLPIGNAGNITALMSGFIKLYKLDIIDTLPMIIGVQTEHANPVYQYYQKPEDSREFKPVEVRPSVAQAAMIGNPVSMPRVVYLADKYNKLASKQWVHVVQVAEQTTMDCTLEAYRNGFPICTQGGESLAGLLEAKNRGILDGSRLAILGATAHAVKFAEFQQKYFTDSFPPEFEVRAKEELQNRPINLSSTTIEDCANIIADMLQLTSK